MKQDVVLLMLWLQSTFIVGRGQGVHN